MTIKLVHENEIKVIKATEVADGFGLKVKTKGYNPTQAPVM